MEKKGGGLPLYVKQLGCRFGSVCMNSLWNIGTQLWSQDNSLVGKTALPTGRCLASLTPPRWCCSNALQFSSVQLLSRVWLFATPWIAARQASLSIINSQSLLKLMSIELVMPSNHLILCHPLLLPPAIFPSIRVFSEQSLFASGGPNIGACFSISPSNEYSGLISFWIDWFDLLAVQRTLKRLL